MSDVTTEKRGPGRPPKPRDEFGNIVRGGSAPEFASPAVTVSPLPSAPPSVAAEPEPAPAPTPEPPGDPSAVGTADRINPADFAHPPEIIAAPVEVDDWQTVIVAGIEHFAARPGEHQQEARAMMAIHRAFKDAKPGPPQPFVTECTGCGNYRCEGLPDSPNCPTCGHPFPAWEERTA